MDRRWMGIIIFLLAIITAVSFLRPRNDGQATPDVGELKVLELGDGRSMRLLGRLLRDHRQAYYYQAEQGGEPAAAPAFFGSLPPGTPLLELQWYETAEETLVGFAADFQPSEVLFMYNFTTGESWPAHAGDETVEELQARGQAMLAPLAEAHPDKALTLWPADGLRPLPVPPNAPYANPN